MFIERVDTPVGSRIRPKILWRSGVRETYQSFGDLSVGPAMDAFRDAYIVSCGKVGVKPRDKVFEAIAAAMIDGYTSNFGSQH